MIPTPEPGIVGTVVALLSALVAGSLFRLVALRRASPETKHKRMASLATWWALTIALIAAVLTGAPGCSTLMAVASLLAFGEFAHMLGLRSVPRTGVVLVGVAVCIHYTLIAAHYPISALLVLQCGVMFLIAIFFLLRGQTTGYIRTVAGLSWAWWILVFGLSHAALLTGLPAASNPTAGPTGWFLYLVLLTETNDIAQALIGRRFGRGKKHRIAPSVSPNKTWEGFLGGLAVTTVLAVALAPALTPLLTPAMVGGTRWPTVVPWFVAAGAGALIAVAGFFGDINMSAVKRDAGFKDSSSRLPGMGGVIDRIDSLSFAAPAFYYYVTIVTGLPPLSGARPENVQEAMLLLSLL